MGNFLIVLNNIVEQQNDPKRPYLTWNFGKNRLSINDLHAFRVDKKVMLKF